MNKAELFNLLSRHLRVSVGTVDRINRSAPHRYRHYTIPKKTGGVRDIHHPTPELKTIQRWIVDNIFSSMPVSEFALAYEQGRSIKLNAEIHRCSNYFLKLDFAEFFPSIKSDWIIEYLSNPKFGLDEDAVLSIVMFVTRVDSASGGLCLSIGAPSSPSLSNRILYELDSAVGEFCLKNGVFYSRYADDLIFSSKESNVLPVVEEKIRGLISSYVPRIKVNEKKTLRLSRKRNVRVTGLVITPQRKISVGREFKRKIKTQVFLFKSDKLAVDEVPKLKGNICFLIDVEKSFVDSLRSKYGSSVISELLS